MSLSLPKTICKNTKNRIVYTVLSHGDVTLEPKDTGKLIEAVKDDIFKEFKKKY